MFVPEWLIWWIMGVTVLFGIWLIFRMITDAILFLLDWTEDEDNDIYPENEPHEFLRRMWKL